MTGRIDVARAYVATTPQSGADQLALLREIGLTPSRYFLEYGCGALHLAQHLIRFLDVGTYHGVDPNDWLRVAAVEADPELLQVVYDRQATFSTRDDFGVDLPVAGNQMGLFDYVYAHSVLSHAAAWQLSQFFERAAALLTAEGRIVASYRLGPYDSDAPRWVYPGVTYFTKATIEQAAGDAGLDVTFPALMRAWHVERQPSEVHDWLIATHA